MTAAHGRTMRDVLDHVGALLRDEYGLNPLRPSNFRQCRGQLIDRIAVDFDVRRAEAMILVDQAADHIDQVTADTTFHLDTPHAGLVVVQHEASGLRARFETPHNGRGFGKILSKTYEVDDISGGRSPHKGTWRRYAGLGIGERIYLRGGEQLPGIRWDAVVVSESAIRVREKLHGRDRYVWEWRHCPVCGDNAAISWREATADELARAH